MCVCVRKSQQGRDRETEREREREVDDDSTTKEAKNTSVQGCKKNEKGREQKRKTFVGLEGVNIFCFRSMIFTRTIIIR